jgi:nickel/cobalt exporter
MLNETMILCGTAASIGLFHTLMGPDHYLPFIALAKTNSWSKVKTFWITFVCGLGHVLSSIILGFVGIGFGIALFKLEKIESIRGDLAMWLLLIFGFLYFAWGVIHAIKNKPHTHFHKHVDGEVHTHEHKHSEVHLHPHKYKNKSLIWGLFIIFIFGPCEPLIPLIMFPAAKGSMISVILVATIFSVVTIGTMLTVVILSLSGLKIYKSKLITRYSHAFAGLIVFCCGGAIYFGL